MYLYCELQSLNNIIADFEKNNSNKTTNTLSEYFTSLTKISNDDIKEIGGDSKRKKKSRRYRTNKKTTKKIRR